MIRALPIPITVKPRPSGSELVGDELDGGPIQSGYLRWKGPSSYVNRSRCRRGTGPGSICRSQRSIRPLRDPRLPVGVIADEVGGAAKHQPVPVGAHQDERRPAQSAAAVSGVSAGGGATPGPSGPGTFPSAELDAPSTAPKRSFHPTGPRRQRGRSTRHGGFELRVSPVPCSASTPTTVG